MTATDPSEPRDASPTARLLVTGAGGFVGGALVRHLATHGRPVVAALRRPTPSLPAGVEGRPGLDLSTRTDWHAALRGVSTVIHCAARVHQLADAAEDPLQSFRDVNRDGTLALARQAVECGVRRFVFVSTIGVNGAVTTDRPFTAQDPPHPHSPYAVSKWEAEEGLRALARDTGLELSVVRPPMVIGAGAPGNVARLMRLLRTGLPLPLAAVRNRRSFVARDNLVDLLARLVDHPGAAGTWLVSDGQELSTPDLLRRLGHAMGRPARLFPLPAALLRTAFQAAGKGEMATSLLSSLVIDSAPTRRALGWMPPVSIDQAIADTAAAYGRPGQPATDTPS